MTALFEVRESPTSSAKLSACGTYRYDLRRRWPRDCGPKCDVPFGRCAPDCSGWVEPRPMVFVGLNPSTATAEVDDPTIRRCIGFAKRESCGELVMLNLYALRATDPGKLLVHGLAASAKISTRTVSFRPFARVAEDAVGPDNNHTIAAVLVEVANRNGIVVAAWGSTDAKLHADRVAVVRKLIGAWPVMCLGTTKDGSPRHPLYLRADAPLIAWSPS